MFHDHLYQELSLFWIQTNRPADKGGVLEYWVWFFLSLFLSFFLSSFLPLQSSIQSATETAWKICNNLIVSPMIDKRKLVLSVT